MANSYQENTASYTYAELLAALGAFGVTLQNYQAVELFLKGIIPASDYTTRLIQVAALGSGGLCSGMVNLQMNIDLLNKFVERLHSDKPYQYESLGFWEQVQYFGGIAVFVVTGILFGLTAFTFAMASPLAILSVAVGLFVAAIMTIQELETWFKSYDPKPDEDTTPLTPTQTLGAWVGHTIAIGNVIALSLLFTLSLAESLMALQFAAFPALMIGLVIAFTFGAFTEFYFYDAYLADFCKDFQKNWQDMMATSYAPLGLLCISTNAFVNTALTYSALELLTGLLITAQVALPPAAVIMGISVIASFFAGSASFILGMDFWVETSKNTTESKPYAFFSSNTPDEPVSPTGSQAQFA